MCHRINVWQMIRVITLISIFAMSTLAHSDSIKHADQRIHIQYGSTLDKAERQQTYDWLRQVTGALLTVYDAWPKDTFNITIQRSSSCHSPVPWGQVIRGNPDTVLLTINPEFDIQEITRDWTAFHELSHLLIPYRGYGDLWFSEGLASYYQNIIQARSGLLSEADLWGKLANGFARGHKQNPWSHVVLAEISDHMGRYRSFMRVHWSGVHYWLTADIKLRQHSKNKTALDPLLKQLKFCCEHKSMSAAAIAQKLDQLAGVDIFKPLFDEYRVSHAIPDYKSILASLGVILGEYAVVLTADAPNAYIRKSIYQGDV